MNIITRSDTSAIYLPAEKETKAIYALLGKFCFFAFIFFTMFGTTLPFRERTFDITEIQTSNITTQIVYISFFLLGLIALLPKYKQVISFMVKEKFVTFFILFALVSVVWSPFPFVSFKRWFQIFAAFVACLGGLFYINSDEELMKYIKPTTAVFIILSLGAALTIPAAKDDYGVWRGLAPSKNHLGQVALFATLIFSYSLIKSKMLGKIVSALLLLMSVILLVGSESSTSQLAFLVVLTIWAFQFVDNRFKALRVGRFFSVLTFIIIIAFAVLAWNLASDLVVSGLAAIGEDMTFTGRTELWTDMLKRASSHIWLGGGYQGYWVLDNNDLMHLYQKYIWLPNQSHNGYIDIFLDLGLVGVSILLAMIVKYFISLIQLKEPHFWKWIVIAILLTNFQESTLFRQGVFLGNFFIFFILLMMVKRYRGTIVHKPAEVQIRGYSNLSSR